MIFAACGANAAQAEPAWITSTPPQRLADQGLRRFAVQIARSDQMLSGAIGAGHLSAEDKQRVRNTLSPFFETLDIRE